MSYRHLKLLVFEHKSVNFPNSFLLPQLSSLQEKGISVLLAAWVQSLSGLVTNRAFAYFTNNTK